MQHDDETTAVQLFHLLKEKGYSISLRTILRCRTDLGWTFRGSSYCQLIRQANKIKRLDWAKINLNDKFQNVVWTDEATIQLETHRRFSCHKKGERPKNKPRYVMYWDLTLWEEGYACLIAQMISVLCRGVVPLLIYQGMNFKRSKSHPFFYNLNLIPRPSFYCKLWRAWYAKLLEMVPLLANVGVSV